MRVTSGYYRGKTILVPPEGSVRPTAEKVRQAVFNTLCHGNTQIGVEDHVRGSRLIDAFCGTGAMAFEALSRGAEHASCIDMDPIALDYCRTNAKNLALSDKMDIISSSALSPPPAREPCSLVFLDPPYFTELVPRALRSLSAAGWIKNGAICVVETSSNEILDWPRRAKILQEKKYGKTRITFLNWSTESI